MTWVLPGFLVLAVFGVPIAFALAAASLLGLLPAGISLTIVPQRIIAGINSFPLLAIPLFILAGNLMNSGGMTRLIIDFANALVGRFRGGLALVNVLDSMFFGGLSGSSVADTSATGVIMIPAMASKGYHKEFAAGITASTSCLAAIIPPSITLIVYGTVTGTSISRLFLAGIVPGILFGLAQGAVAYGISVRRGYGRERPATFQEIVTIGRKAIWPLLLPLVIIGGIRFGLFTPTEGAAVAVLYSLIIGIFVLKELRLKSIVDAILESGIMVGAILLVIGTAQVFSWLLVVADIPDTVSRAILNFTENPLLVLALINVLLLIVGCFLEANAALLIFVPVLFPLVTRLGIDPVHFGLVVIFNLSLGLVTPPVGTCLMVAARIADIPLHKAAMGALPFFAVGVAMLLLFTYVPGLITFVPNWLLPPLS